MGLAGVAMDGKTLRMSAQCGAADAHLVSLFSHRLGVVLARSGGGDKTNEITASADALAMLLLTGVVITADAMFTQRAIARTILDAGNDYLLVVKENQPTLHEEIAMLFADPDAAVSVAEETSTHSQRIEQRRLRASTELVGYTRLAGTGADALHGAARHRPADGGNACGGRLCRHVALAAPGHARAVADAVA